MAKVAVLQEVQFTSMFISRLLRKCWYRVVYGITVDNSCNSYTINCIVYRTGASSL